MEADMNAKVKKYIIKSSPYGEHRDIIADLKKLTDVNVDDATLLGWLKEHNEEHLAIVRNETSKLVITQTGSQENYYIDQREEQIVYVNHYTQQITSTAPLQSDLDPKVASLRKEIDNAMRKYANAYFKDADLGVYVYADGDPSNVNIYAVISCKNLSFKNFYGGEWLSEWKISNTALEGKVRINAHYFEDGNLQMKQSKTFSEKLGLTLDNTQQEAGYIVDLIEKFEMKLQVGLEKMYEDMPDYFFKSMRRALPVTGTLFEWNGHLHKVVNTLKQN